MKSKKSERIEILKGLIVQDYARMASARRAIANVKPFCKAEKSIAIPSDMKKNGVRNPRAMLDISLMSCLICFFDNAFPIVIPAKNAPMTKCRPISSENTA